MIIDNVWFRFLAIPYTFLILGMPKSVQLIRCGWVGSDPEMIHYHDTEWGRPVHDDRLLFEMLTLEGAQAGLSWSTVLKKRKYYQKAFAEFDVKKVAGFSASKVEKILKNEGLIRNRLKIQSVVKNASAFMGIQKSEGSFSQYIWSFTDGKVVCNHPKNWKEVPARTELSDRISRDLKKRGFSFVGSTICYAYLQAIGVVEDHVLECFCKKSIKP